jgi:hypothetical protein
MSQISEVYSNLLKSAPKPSLLLTDEEDDKIDCFDLNKAPLLKALVEAKYAAAKYVHIEYLESEGEVVLNLSFYEADGEHVGGAEITKETVFWDDDVDLESSDKHP